jgi:hypothetical protein
MKNLNQALLLGFIVFTFFFITGCSSSGGDDGPTAKSAPESNDNPYDLPDDPWADYKGLKAGFGRAPIIDVGDDYKGYLISGFNMAPWNRTALGVHDPIYSIATVIDDGKTRIGIVAIDAFSISINDTQIIRDEVCSKYGIDHLIVHSVHNHDVPDNSGIYSVLNFYDFSALQRCIELNNKSAIEAIRLSVKNLEPAQMYTGEVLDKDQLNLTNDERIKLNLKDMNKLTEPNDLGLSDLRPPFVTDNGLRIAVFKSPKDGHVIGTLVNWGNHVETVWQWNQLISADFVGYMRNSLFKKFGGETMFITGNTGSVSVYVSDPVVFYDKEAGKYVLEYVSSRVVYNGEEYWGRQYEYGEYNEENFIKAEALGNELADIIAEAIESGKMEINSSPEIKYYILKDQINIQNNIYLLAFAAGLLDRKANVSNGSLSVETELNALKIGDLWMLTLPGELYPEIAKGGVRIPPEGDYSSSLSEADLKMIDVPLRELMHGKVNMIMNLGNDHLGYFIPKSQWDEKEPFTFGNLKAPYGEENSMSPDAATKIYEYAAKLLEQVQN